jgi:hypothetical protein
MGTSRWRILRLTGYLAVLALVAIVVGSLAWTWGYGRGKQTAISDTGPTIIQLERLSEFATVRVHVADVLEAENPSWWGTIRGAWLIKGDALLSVDMERAKVVNSDKEARKITVLLPQPRVIQPRVDHNKTVMYDWQKGLLRSTDVAKEVWAQAMKHAQRLVEQVAGEPEEVDLCRRQTEAALKQIYSYAGWDLQVQWEEKK